MTLPIIVEVIDSKYMHTELHIDTGDYITTYRRSRDLDVTLLNILSCSVVRNCIKLKLPLWLSKSLCSLSLHLVTSSYQKVLYLAAKLASKANS